MDRQLDYPGQIPLETDVLSTNKNAYIAIAKLAAGILGTNTLINGFNCQPTAPASLQVSVGAGEIYSLQNIDNTAYSSVAADTNHQILKQGINLDAVTLNCDAPVTVGNSINYLVQIAFSETDGGSTILPYYNSANPAQPYAGPNNSGLPNYTIRQNTANITVKAGASAPTGTQTTPAPDIGFVGAWVVTVANGQSIITSGNISLYDSAPFITETLTQKISQTTADGRYAQKTQIQAGLLTYAVDTGAANAYAAALSPAITSYTAGLKLDVKIANANTGASTLNVNGLGNKNIKFMSGVDITANALVAGMIASFEYDGTNFQLLNPAIPSLGYNFSVTIGTPQNIAPDVITKILWDTANINRNNAFDLINHEFVAPEAGDYHFDALVNMQTFTNSGVLTTIYLYKNGVEVLRSGAWTDASGSDNPCAVISDNISLNAGDTVAVYVDHNDSTTDQTNTGIVGVGFSGYKLPYQN